MQTLVYENYNKFISATDTIRKVNNLKQNNFVNGYTKCKAKGTYFGENGVLETGTNEVCLHQKVRNRN